MSRLLHAAARGARIQYRYPTWVDPDLWDDGNTQLYGALMAQARYKAHLRIHPEDVHLQYGPISSALRGDAEIAPAFYFDARISEESCYAIAKARKSGLYDMADELHRSLFLLILAEALADEGL